MLKLRFDWYITSSLIQQQQHKYGMVQKSFLLRIFTFNYLHGYPVEKTHIHPYNLMSYCVACVVHRETLGCHKFEIQTALVS